MINSMKKAAIVIITESGATQYSSIRAASRATGISKDRLCRALKSDTGCVANTIPIVCIDDQSEIVSTYSLSSKCLGCSIYKEMLRK